MRRLALLLLAVAAAAAQPQPLVVMVIGDRTGSARPEVFRKVMSEAKLVAPEIVASVGDIIEGYSDDPAILEAQWDTMQAELASSGAKVWIAPGNHDITDSAAEAVYRRRVGEPNRVFRHKSATFIFFDNSRWSSPAELPPGQWRWLAAELGRARKAPQLFVLMHRPYWRYALERGTRDSLHALFVKSGVDAVFTGHDHFYCRHRQDGIDYFSVGPSGSRTKVVDDREAGAFQNYIVLRTMAGTTAYELREPGRDKPLDVNCVTFESFTAFRHADSSALRLSPVPAAVSVCTLAVVNLSSLPTKGRMFWNDTATGWRVQPRVIDYNLAPGGRFIQTVRCSLVQPDSVYPAPRLELPYEYLPGRRMEIRRRLPVRRRARVARTTRPVQIDGRLNDGCWAGPGLAGFGGSNGGRADVEPVEVRFALDESTLYIAARCRESEPAKVRAAVLARDGRVTDDDHINIVIDPHPGDSVYYQLFVNVAGTVADRRCVMRAGRSDKDYGWNARVRSAAGTEPGAWTVELAVPLADIEAGPGDWGVNAVRFQSRVDKVSVWQAPFEHDPAALGRLLRD